MVYNMGGTEKASAEPVFGSAGFDECSPHKMKAALDIIEESEAQLWWAGKEFKKNNRLSDYVGKNEKTKIIVKIQKKGQGAPAREPVISGEDHKQMILYYHRRQEELKKLEENDDDSFLDSEWADSHALKRHFHGVKDIKWRPR
ncbi:cilia- and flagella-associated protein 298-like [Sceloporus undulatus]|uniref:cilia- and flagella-associated protein 298-like n=1 Tax=Sceloporus undulatus TaxID=8520 RepID=UPI001C4D6B9A|nr:cilia- and flagella-associated protein 298-like [Sceloporus undulatus]